ncbi:MAG: hypothetical protein M1833_002461 [Piccolia ochrophora]|nr:MAG: hypothetical protein M1833_002461 [Piccolia ochrophora]
MENANGEDDEGDDYMTMAIAEPTPAPTTETYTQRRQRKEREVDLLRSLRPSRANGAELKNPKSKAERARLAETARETALSQPLHATAPDSKGLRMMRAMGFQPGGVLGKPSPDSGARAEPLALDVKEGRAGVGLDAERKRKVREEWEGQAKRIKAEEGEYRERVAREREEKRSEGLWWAAMKVAERLDEDDTTPSEPPADEVLSRPMRDAPADAARQSERGAPTPLGRVPLSYRALIRDRRSRELDRRRRYDLHQSLSRTPTYEESDEDDRLATGGVEEEVEEDDDALDALEASNPKARLQDVVRWLRDRHWYCFWCKEKYGDVTLDGCPGVEEDDHE